MRLWLIVGLLVLTGCNAIPMEKLWGAPLTPEELAAVDKQNADAQAKGEEERAQKIISKYRPMCSQLGFKEGTPDFSNCVLKLYSNDETNKATRKSGGGSTFTRCSQFGDSVNCTSF